MPKGVFSKHTSNRRHDPLKLSSTILLVLLICIVFGQILQHEFVNYDDNLYITENFVVQAGLTAKGIIWAFTDTNTGHWHPLTWLSHMLDCQLYGLNPRGHHATSLVLHILNTVLLLLILQKATGEFWKSFFVASFFALHPLHVESVAWAAERKDVLSTFFWTLTVLTYVFYSEKPKVSLYLLTLLFFALGLMAKPMLVTLPFVLLLLDYWPLNRFEFEIQGIDSRSQTQRAIQPDYPKFPVFRLVLEKLPFFILSAFSSFLAYIAAASIGTVGSLESVPLMMRLANGLIAYANYMGKMFWPQGLAVFYPHPGSSLTLWQAAGAGLLLVGITILVMRAARTYPYLPVGWLWYIGTLVPVIGLVQVGAQAIADRYTYVPLTGLFIMIAWGIPQLLAGWRYRRIGLTVVAGTLLSALTICTWSQIQNWRDSLKLFGHTLEVTANNYVAHNLLGAALANRGAIQEALPHYHEALKIRPLYAEAHRNLAGALASLGMLEKGVAHYNKALQIQPRFAEAHNDLGEALARQGEFDEAIAHFYEALRIRPNFAGGHNNLGNVLAAQNKLDEAIRQYQEALRLIPNYADAHSNLAVVLARQGRLEEAALHYNEALRINPNSAEAHLNLGVALLNLGRVEQAIDHYMIAVKIKPDYAEAHNNLGNALAQQGRLDEAIVHFSKALEIRAKYPEAHNNLGVALARQGRLQEAIAHFNEALRFKPDYAQAQANLDIALQEAGKTGAN